MQEQLIAGVDEAGRGPLAGPVVAAAVILNPKKPIAGLKDSKKISEKKREVLFDEIIEKALCYSIARAEVEEIDQINILQASLLAMRRSILSLSVSPQLVLIDGNQIPKKIPYPAEYVIRGDQKIAEISAASILAKVTRDKEMYRLHELYPQYNFAKNKGYPTASHINALNEFGVSEIHRKSFSPVKVLC